MFAKEVIEEFYGSGEFSRAKVVYGDTDSLFVTFSPRDPNTGTPLEGRAAREAVIELTEEAGHLVTQALKPPHDFEFDKVFDPLLMFSKKRYAGRMYESNPDDFVYKYMGIALKRRDNAPIVKMIYGAAMRKVLDEQDVNGAQEIVKQGCMDLVKGKYGFGPLTITKSLRADYADPTRIAHKALADRMTARDPGNAPASGDRIPYIYVMPEAGQQASKLQGDRIEHPQYIRDNNLKPDYEYYIHRQLTNPIAQMFAILLENMSDFKRSMLPKEYKELTDDKKMTVRESIAGDLLFREALQKCSAEQQRAFITKHFGFAPTVKSSDGPTMKKVASNNSLEQQQQNVKQSSILSYFSMRDLDAALVKTRQTTRKKAQAQTDAKVKK
jgi:DNA polymerase elongation subunit (family B)